MNASHRALIAYYSLTGNTARVARDLATRLHADIESIQDLTHGVGGLGQFVAAFDAWRKAPAKIAALQHDPAQYEITIIGTPVWTWQMTPAVRAYIEQTRDRTRSVAFFVTSGDTDVAKIQASLEALAGHKAIASAGFNANELRDTVAYQRKLSAFVEEITRAGRFRAKPHNLQPSRGPRCSERSIMRLLHAPPIMDSWQRMKHAVQRASRHALASAETRAHHRPVGH